MFDFKYKDYSFGCEIGTMTPLQYIRMINILEEFRPKRICELGSGQSTDIINLYSKKVNATAYSIENDPYWNTHNSIMLPLIENTTITIGNNEYDKCTIYEGFEDWLKGQDKFDFVLIDGPNDTLPKNEHNLIYSRIQMLSFLLLDKLNDNAVIIYHDSNLPEAEATLKEFEKLLDYCNIQYDKEVIVETDKQIIEYNVSILGICPELTIYKINK